MRCDAVPSIRPTWLSYPHSLNKKREKGRLDYKTAERRLAKSASALVLSIDEWESAGAAALGLLVRSLPEPEPVTVAETEPIVAEGMAALRSPFKAVATLERFAKPTDGGLKRKTEYTFLRNVSPTIQLGVELPGDELRSKNAPRHEDCESCVSLKSAGDILQLAPPNAIDTVTSVSHGYSKYPS